jgi:hypothetical protein
MKNRLLTNWTFTRVLYLTMGVLVGIQSIYNQQWFGLAFGAYFASMGLFAFGCAAGNCAITPSNSFNSSSETDQTK